MSYETTREAVGALNSGIQTQFESGDPIMMNVLGRPSLDIISFQPLVYRKFGALMHRAPLLDGSFPLRGFLCQQHPNGSAIIFPAVEIRDKGFGIHLNQESTKKAVEGVAAFLGVTVEFTPV